MQYLLLSQALKDLLGFFLCKGSHCVEVEDVAVLETMEMGWGWVGRSTRDTYGCLCAMAQEQRDGRREHELVGQFS